MGNSTTHVHHDNSHAVNAELNNVKNQLSATNNRLNAVKNDLSNNSNELVKFSNGINGKFIEADKCIRMIKNDVQNINEQVTSSFSLLKNNVATMANDQILHEQNTNRELSLIHKYNWKQQYIQHITNEIQTLENKKLNISLKLNQKLNNYLLIKNDYMFQQLENIQTGMLLLSNGEKIEQQTISIIPQLEEELQDTVIIMEMYNEIDEIQTNMRNSILKKINNYNNQELIDPFSVPNYKFALDIPTIDDIKIDNEDTILIQNGYCYIPDYKYADLKEHYINGLKCIESVKNIARPNTTINLYNFIKKNNTDNVDNIDLIYLTVLLHHIKKGNIIKSNVKIMYFTLDKVLKAKKDVNDITKDYLKQFFTNQFNDLSIYLLKKRYLKLKNTNVDIPSQQFTITCPFTEYPDIKYFNIFFNTMTSVYVTYFINNGFNNDPIIKIEQNKASLLLGITTITTIKFTNMNNDKITKIIVDAYNKMLDKIWI